MSLELRDLLRSSLRGRPWPIVECSEGVRPGASLWSGGRFWTDFLRNHPDPIDTIYGQYGPNFSFLAAGMAAIWLDLPYKLHRCTEREHGFWLKHGADFRAVSVDSDGLPENSEVSTLPTAPPPPTQQNHFGELSLAQFAEHLGMPRDSDVPKILNHNSQYEEATGWVSNSLIQGQDLRWMSLWMLTLPLHWRVVDSPEEQARPEDWTLGAEGIRSPQKH